MRHIITLLALTISLAAPLFAEKTIRIPEGYNIFDIAKLLADEDIVTEKAFIAACYDTNLLAKYDIPNRSFEGYLAPGPYLVHDTCSAEELIVGMVTYFFTVFDREMLETRAEELGLTLNELVTLASIIQKERSTQGDHGLVASVFYNRLARDMKLQSTVTVMYVNALVKGQSLKRPIVLTKEDLTRDHAYNTYTRKGLPPGPIAAVSVASMRGALYPESTGYIFFCADGMGGNVFAYTYEEHKMNVEALRARRGE